MIKLTAIFKNNFKEEVHTIKLKISKTSLLFFQLFDLFKNRFENDDSY